MTISQEYLVLRIVLSTDSVDLCIIWVCAPVLGSETRGLYRLSFCIDWALDFCGKFFCTLYLESRYLLGSIGVLLIFLRALYLPLGGI